jgi:hypothetical protein
VVDLYKKQAACAGPDGRVEIVEIEAFGREIESRQGLLCMYLSSLLTEKDAIKM